MTLKAFAIALASASLLFSSCKKEDDQIIDEGGLETNITRFEPVHLWDAEPFNVSTDYVWADGHVRFQEIKFFLSDFHFHGMSSDVHTMFMNQAWLVNAANSEVQTIGYIPFDHVHEWHLTLGLNETLNHAEDPANAPAPLNDGGMHWSWNPEAGYKFIKVIGEQDVDGDGTFEGFEIHVATDATKREFDIEVSQDEENGEYIFDLKIDYKAMFEGVDFGNLVGTHGGSDLTNGIADNLAGAISM